MKSSAGRFLSFFKAELLYDVKKNMKRAVEISSFSLNEMSEGLNV